MNDRKFVNQFQPQTLVIATLLCYLDAAFGLLGAFGGGASLLGLFMVFGLGFGGYGIANEKKWGYGLAVAAAILQVIVLIAFARSDVFKFPLILTLFFDGALVALLLHPQSRDYQRIWFK